jgi:hypothetical protein
MEVFVLGEMMPKKLTVKNVKQFISGYDYQYLGALQQVLAWFGEARKLERILWATLKRVELDSKARAERVRVHGEAVESKGVKGPPLQVPGEPEFTELHPLTIVIGKCPRCDGNVMGEVRPVCSKIRRQPTFYKECSACTYYAEIWRKIKQNKTTYREEEGG